MSSPELPEGFFTRQDESPDEHFYVQPRMVAHIDDATISALTTFYQEMIPPRGRVLDLMSSWISHLPDSPYEHISGLGMNADELAANPVLNDWCVHNLNETPRLPYDDDRFDAVIIAVSVQYLTSPFAVFAEIARCLVPGGLCIVAMSHRCFPTKAVQAFHLLPPEDRVRLVASYMSSSDAFEQINFTDRSPPDADPLWIVHGHKAA